MRVALVIERFLPDGGGMEAVAWQVAHGLAAAGEEVSVLARESAASSAVRTHAIRVRSQWQPIRVLSFARACSELLQQQQFDVVHAFSRTLHQDLYRAGGGSHAHYMRRAYGKLGATLRRATPRHALLLGLERKILRDPRQTIQCGSRMVRDEIASGFGVPAERLRVIHNGVDSERFHPGDGAAVERERAADLPSAPGCVWLVAGSGWHRKGVDIALRALAQSSDQEAHLWIVGRDRPAPWQALAERLGIAERVAFLGQRHDPERLYRAADALLLPSRYDAFANVCLEAAASGLAVVTSGANGSGELFGNAGIVVDDPEDVAGFADALDRLQSQGLRQALGEAGRTLALELSWERHVETLRLLYKELRS